MTPEQKPAFPPDLEALMPEPAGFRTRYRSEPGMIGDYPWTYADIKLRRRRNDHPGYEYEDLYTATQMREAILAATERAATICEQHAVDAPFMEGHLSAMECAAAIRGASGQEGGGAI